MKTHAYDHGRRDRANGESPRYKLECGRPCWRNSGGTPTGSHSWDSWEPVSDERRGYALDYIDGYEARQ